MNEMDMTSLHEKLIQELRRGVLVMVTLSQLSQSRYGYELISHMAEQGLEVEQGTLYPLLRRLESQGLLMSKWNVDSNRPRRYYKISPAGREVLERLVEDWRALALVIENLLTDTYEKDG